MKNFLYLQDKLVDLLEPKTPDLTNLPSYYEEVIYGKTKWFRCTFPDCSKAYRYKSEIIRHNVCHFDHRPYYCTFEGCNKAFTRFDTLDAHLRIHSGVKPFECKFSGCDFKSKTRSGLRYHSLKHESTKKYECKNPGCDKSFLTKAHLQQHQGTETCNKRKGTITKKEESESPSKFLKREEASSENKYVEIDDRAFENSVKVEPVYNQDNSDSQKIENNLKHMLEELLIENKIMKAYLENAKQNSSFQQMNFSQYFSIFTTQN